MKSRVMQAIRERRLLFLNYGRGRQLIVAPYILGQTMTGYAALLCWQVGQAEGETTNWRLLDIESIRAVRMLGQHFGPPPGRRDLTGSEFSTIEAVV